MNENESAAQDEIRSEIMVQLRYEILSQMLLDAAKDCDERGHAKNIGQRFRDAADVCEHAGQRP